MRRFAKDFAHAACQCARWLGQTANPARLEALRGAGVTLCWGDLKDASSLRDACFGAEAVISTASSTFSRQEGDSIETVDREGQLSLIAAAHSAGVEHFTFVSIPRNLLRESPLTRAKAEVARALEPITEWATPFWRPTTSWRSG